MFARYASPFGASILMSLLPYSGAFACGSSQSSTVSNPTSVNIQAAVNTAISYLSGCSSDTYTITLAAGRYSLGQPPNRSNGDSPHAAIDVSGALFAGAQGSLIINGAGQSNGGTRLNISNSEGKSLSYAWVYGRSAFNVTISNIHFGADYLTASQGTVVSVNQSAGTVTLSIPAGFPTPLDLWNADTYNTSPPAPTGLYMRAYTNSASNPTLIQDVETNGVLTVNNVQIPWGDVVSGSTATPTPPTQNPDGTWTIYLDYPGTNLAALGAWAPNTNLICIKAKSAGGGYTFLGSQHITFDHITFTEFSRGVFHVASSNNTVSNSSILREPARNGQVPCLSTSEGGPQFGQAGDPTFGNTVVNFVAQATGDDTVAFFDDDGATGPTPQPAQSTISNLNIADSFVRFVLETQPSGGPAPNINAIAPITATDCDTLLLGAGNCPISYSTDLPN